MSCKDVRRIRLDLSEVLNEKPRVWFLINPKPYNAETVKHLKKRLEEKFHFQNGLNFSLYLDEFEIPEDESVLIFRDDDLVVVKQVGDGSSRSSTCCAEESHEVISPSSSTIVTERKTKKRKRNSEDDDEINSERVRRKRIDSEEANRNQSCSPSPEPEVADCSDEEQPSSPVQLTAVPKKKKHKTNKKKKDKKKKKKEKESKDEEIDDDEHKSDADADPEPAVEVATAEAEESSPKTPTPKKRRKRNNRKKTNKGQSPVENIDENLANTSSNGHRIAAPLNFGRWQPAGNHLRFDDQGILNSESIAQPDDAEEQEKSLDEVASVQQKGPIVIQRRKKAFPEDLPAEKEAEMQEKDRVQEPCTVAPRADYSACSTLEGPPRVGDIIAYKELELSATYCPEVTEYKEGAVTRYDPISKVVTVEFLQPIVRKVATGRFELRTPPPIDEYGEYVETEQEETITMTEGTIALDCMIEPKLISVPCSQRSPAY